MKDIIASVVYIVLQILFIPLAVMGAGVVAYKQILVSKKLGVSQTAIEIINGRWTLAVFRLRDDPATVKLNRVLPNNSVFGLWLALLPLYIRYRISGKHWLYPTIADRGEERLANIVLNRTLYFDNIIMREKDHVAQFVVMGAGFDTRCYGELQHSNLKCFELDQPTTQQFKRQHLQKAGIDASHVRFVEVDFSSQQWYEELEKAGYDPTKKTLFLWEGVTLYLGEQAVRNTLREMQAHSAVGSVVVADIYAKRFITGDYAPGLKASLPVLDMTDETLGFGLDFSDDYEQSLQAFVESEGGHVGETYFMGHKTKKGTWMVVADISL